MPEETQEAAEVSSKTSSLLSPCPTTLVNVTTSGSCSCPPMTSFSAIYGTGVYSADSHLCSAAVHSGVINASTGGDVSYTMVGSRDYYCGSTRNGVTSISYLNNYGSSYSLGMAELLKQPREYVTHTYSYYDTLQASTFTTTRSSTCLFSPVSIQFEQANDGELFAVGSDGFHNLLDGEWYPRYTSYARVSTTATACDAACPN